MSQLQYGFEDHSFQAAGGEEGIQKLVVAFYRVMHENAEFSPIRHMHPDDLSTSIDKLARFLCGWLGGPKRFQQKYGPIRIPIAHLPFDIDKNHRDQWLACMQLAVQEQTYPEDFKTYLIEQLAVPADRIVMAQSRKSESL